MSQDTLFDTPATDAQRQQPQVGKINGQKPPIAEQTPGEHTLSCDEAWAYPGGNFGQRLSQDLLEDPRVRKLTPKTLGILVMVRAHWEAGRGISAKSASACRDLRLTRAAWQNVLDELTECQPPLVEVRQGVVQPTSFGRPIRRGLSEVRSRAAQARWERVNADPGVVRPPEPVVPDAPFFDPAPTVLSSAAPQPDFFGGVGADSAPRPETPYQELVNLYAKYCKGLPQVSKVSEWPTTRKKRLATAWKENPSLEFWEGFFKDVGESDWLCGRKAGSRGAFLANWDWIMQQPNLMKIREGNYKNTAGRGASMFEGGRFTPSAYGASDVDPNAGWLQSGPAQ